MRSRGLPIAVLVWICLLGCSKEGGTLSTPLVRIDLRDQLAAEVRKRALRGQTLECEQLFSISKDGVEQSLRAAWRVLDLSAAGGGRFLLAVEATPAGTTRGAHSPRGSASVGEPKNVATAQAPLQTVTLRVHFEAQKGCSRIKAEHELVLRADDGKHCKQVR